MTSKQRRFSKSYRMNIKQPIPSNRKYSITSRSPSIAHQSDQSTRGKTLITDQEELDNSNGLVMTRWKSVLKSNAYRKNNNPKRGILNNENNSTSCIIQ
jgi:hypothetical protein